MPPWGSSGARREGHRRACRTCGPWALGLVLLVLGACTGTRSAPDERRLVVFAAASLRDAFTAIGERFEQDHPGVRVIFNFAGTQELRAQVEHGAVADVFASADQRHMDALVAAGRAAAPAIFARNEPVVVVARESAGAIRSFEDLPSAERIALGAAEVPIGRYTSRILENAGDDFRRRVESRVVSRELNVRQVLARVALGEAQAGIVYRSDAIAAGDEVSVVSIPAGVNVIAGYPIAVLAAAAQPQLAGEFVQLVLSPEGRKRLEASGFAP